ncbi:MAG: class II aldolase/adducin family protein [Lachnospiraceae bacterium]|nr:class II aldolase/adducin family protein [Lachnospiraceae bacterium]
MAIRKRKREKEAAQEGQKEASSAKKLDAETLREQKMAVIRVAHMLVERGLMIHTFGNVSRRSDRDHFVVTPSGVRYEDLSVDKIVRVNIRSLSYKGSVLPSSEAAMHAAVYQVREDAGFIIHTHQPYASCASALGEEEIYLPHTEIEAMEKITRLPIASYAAPGSANLATNVTDTIARFPDCYGLLIENHGVLCWGRNERQARARAESIEILCYTYLAEYCNTLLQYGITERFSSVRNNGEITFADPSTPERVRRIHRAIYAKRPDIREILHTDGEPEHIVSARYTELKPLFDDFAQIVGTRVPIPGNDREANTGVIAVKEHVNAVMTPGDGAFCMGRTRQEAEACARILNKNCIARIALTRCDKDGALPYLHCVRMNRDYRKRYSQIAAQYAD